MARTSIEIIKARPIPKALRPRDWWVTPKKQRHAYDVYDKPPKKSLEVIHVNRAVYLCRTDNEEMVTFELKRHISQDWLDRDKIIRTETITDKRMIQERVHAWIEHLEMVDGGQPSIDFRNSMLRQIRWLLLGCVGAIIYGVYSVGCVMEAFSSVSNWLNKETFLFLGGTFGLGLLFSYLEYVSLLVHYGTIENSVERKKAIDFLNDWEKDLLKQLQSEENEQGGKLITLNINRKQ